MLKIPFGHLVKIVMLQWSLWTLRTTCGWSKTFMKKETSKTFLVCGQPSVTTLTALEAETAETSLGTSSNAWKETSPYPLETVEGMVYQSEFSDIPDKCRAVLSWSGFGETTEDGVWYYDSLDRLIMVCEGETIEAPNPQDYSLTYDQRGPSDTILLLDRETGSYMLQMDFSTYTINKVKVEGGFLFVAGMEAGKFTPESVTQREKIMEEYFEKSRNPEAYGRHFVNGKWVAVNAPVVMQVPSSKRGVVRA